MSPQELYNEYASNHKMKQRIECYARTLYNNYRVRTGMMLPEWKEASAYIRREFRLEAVQELGL